MSSTPNRRELTHDRIVEVASRALRSHGYAGVGVADVMKRSGLTHGGFYAHFGSRDAMLVEAFGRAGRDGANTIAQAIERRQARGESALRALVETYLSDAHLADAECGCAVAALASEMPRQSATLAEASAAGVQALIGMVRQALPPSHNKEQAMAITANLVGALQLARALGANAQGKAMLAASRRALLSQHEPGG